MATDAQTAVVTATAAFVRQELVGNDASHDWNHIERVWRQAVSLATNSSLSPDEVHVVELAAILHDIADWKYSGSETAGVEQASAFLRGQGCDAALVQRVGWIIERVSFHDELGRSEEEREAMKFDLSLAVVQDADRLDAIGAIGVARTLTFGGKKMRPLYDDGTPRSADAEAAVATRAEYMKGGKKKAAPTIDHFFEKLLHLKSMMKTDAGRAVADARHEFMLLYLEQFFGELKGER